MLTAKINDGEIIEAGQVKNGDVYPDRCCQGYGWEVRMIFRDNLHPHFTEYWGWCLNEHCPNFDEQIGPSDPYRGLSHICHEDFAEWLAERAEAVQE